MLGFYGKRGGAGELLTPAGEERAGFHFRRGWLLGWREERQGFYHEDASSPGGCRGPTGQMTSEVLTGTLQGGG